MPATDPRVAAYAAQILTDIDDSIAEGALPASVRTFTDLHTYCDANDFLTDAGVPFDGTPTGLDLTVTVQDEVTRLLQAAGRPWCSYGTCRYPGHDHTTTQAHDGSELPEPAPMHCTDCGRPAHYDTKLGDYRHDDPAAPDCFLIHR
ncbi:hypothetical protein AB0M46_47460 [Dactylosporangium sp. NPDC051485]|uniref:hypothetical protein n=1 Tax=Dactylosporangium sp. NPDC051485 TaxID=3154846 RepID=UPI003417871D